MGQTEQSDTDDDPIVIDPEDAELGEEPASEGALGLLARRSAGALAAAPAAQSFLRSHGIDDERVWTAFRIGAGGAAVAAGWSAAEQDAFRRLGLLGLRHGLMVAGEAGINLPAVDPQAMDRVLGIIRVNFAQAKPRWATPPAGIACAGDLATAEQVVLVDAPIMGLRLAQAGVRGIGIVLDPVVLPALAPFLKTRSVILGALRRARLDAMAAALQGSCPRLRCFTLQPTFSNLSPDIVAMLGLASDAFAETDPPPPLTPLLLAELVRFARGHLANGAAAAALASLRAAIPDLIAAYRVGFLPADYHQALSKPMQAALQGQRLGGCLILPAYDEDGSIVDLLIQHPASGTRFRGLHAEPQGLLAPELARAHTDVLVTSSLRGVARLFAAGYRNVMFLRGAIDAQRNAARLAHAGVHHAELRVRHEAEGIAAALHACGISVTEGPGQRVPGSAVAAAPSAPQAHALPTQVLAPSSLSQDPVEPLSLVADDAADEVLTFAAGPVRYAIERRADGQSFRRITVRANGQPHQDRFDLASDAQCLRFAQGAARRVGVPAEVIGAHLHELRSALPRFEESATSRPAVHIGAAERAQAEALLASPDLLERMAVDLGSLGWVGEQQSKQILILTAVSRLLPRPLWVLSRASAGSTPWQAIQAIAALVPPEELVVHRRMTAALLGSVDPEALRHRLLLIDQAEALRPETALALRVLAERGALGWATAHGAAAEVDGRASLGEVRGPVAVLAAAVGEIDIRCRDAFLVLPVDESVQQTAAILAEQCRSYAHGSPGPRVGLLAVHHAAQRLLERRAVNIPFADRVDFPAASLRHRADHARFLGLIAASALLHQRQRAREGDAIVADERDFAIVAALTAGLLGSGGDGFPRAARQALQRIQGAGITSLSIREMAALLPDWTRYGLRAALRDLLDHGHLAAAPPRRGRLRQYVVSPSAAAALRDGVVTLKPVGSHAAAREGDKANGGDAGFANVNPREAAG